MFSQHDFINRGQFQYVKEGGAVPSKSQLTKLSCTGTACRQIFGTRITLGLQKFSFSSPVTLCSQNHNALTSQFIETHLCLQFLLSLTYSMVYWEELLAVP